MYYIPTYVVVCTYLFLDRRISLIVVVVVVAVVAGKAHALTNCPHAMHCMAMGEKGNELTDALIKCLIDRVIYFKFRCLKRQTVVVNSNYNKDDKFV